MAVRSGRGPSEKARTGPSGHNLDLGVYMIITLAEGPALLGDLDSNPFWRRSPKSTGMEGKAARSI
jgi:hypothetical protein